MEDRVNQILDFWFKEALPEEWFRKKDSFDNRIKKKFFDDYNKATNNEYDDWQDKPHSCLALVILLDQFSRNLFRNHKKAFSQDQKCRLIVNESIDKGDLNELNVNEKLFHLLPLLHSEEISDHIYVHKLCDLHLKNHSQIKLIKNSWNNHTDVIKRFKRYPHRNEILNRKSTMQEINFLKDSNSTW